MSAILDFYNGVGTDNKGRYLSDYDSQTDQWWESCHNHVQWAFPLPEPSKAQPESPVASDSDYEAISRDPVLKARMMAMVGRYILFLERTSPWRLSMDHNHLRITRVIRCLCLCGLNDMAFDFCEYVKAVAGKAAGKTTVYYWTESLKRNPDWLKG